MNAISPQKIKVSVPSTSHAQPRWSSSPIRTLVPKLIGFDDFFDLMDKAINGEVGLKADNYPPRNIIKLDDNRWEIQFAVAGFSKEDLHISVKQNTLSISGRAQEPQLDEGASYLLHGIGYRNFEHTITFPENAVITPTLKDGLLKVLIEKPIIVEEEQKILEIL